MGGRVELEGDREAGDNLPSDEFEHNRGAGDALRSGEFEHDRGIGDELWRGRPDGMDGLRSSGLCLFGEFDSFRRCFDLEFLLRLDVVWLSLLSIDFGVAGTFGIFSLVSLKKICKGAASFFRRLLLFLSPRVLCPPRFSFCDCEKKEISLFDEQSFHIASSCKSWSSSRIISKCPSIVSRFFVFDLESLLWACLGSLTELSELRSFTFSATFDRLILLLPAVLLALLLLSL